MKKLALFCSMLLTLGVARADEGMWLPLFAGKYNIADMQAKGFKLSAEDIYNENRTSMKEAIVLFGRGCTGEIISDKGLIITNHHCGYGNIQSHSSVEKNYLKDGFWAYTQEEELPNPGLSVRILVKMEDVTDRILKGITKGMTENERQNVVYSNSMAVADSATKDNGYKASVESMFYGNQYIMFVYEEFRDIRLVGAPPSAIGKFGGDTDNWMWPRHTGDFSLFRIYADKDNKPANYSPNNVPYTPRRSFKISAKGIKEGDFTMVYGFPGRTQEYLPASSIKNIVEINNPNKIRLRTKRLDIQNAEMERSAAVRIQYAAKNANVSNAWKKWQGELKGLVRLNTIERKQAFEKSFTEWAIKNNLNDYATVVAALDSNNAAQAPLLKIHDFRTEAVFAIEAVRLASAFDSLVINSKEKKSANVVRNLLDLSATAAPFFKDYYEPIDRKTFVAMMDEYDANVPAEYQPDEVKALKKKYGSFAAMADKVYGSSVFTDKDRFFAFMKNYKPTDYKTIEKDPLYIIAMSVIGINSVKVNAPLRALLEEQDLLMRTYMKGQMDYEPSRTFYPDANLTLRFTYGKVGGFEPLDAVAYKHQSTIEGIMQKDNPAIYDYDVPTKLKELYKAKDYGRYGVNGTMPVAFVASNHTTGGNSGSPVLNANGELIGVNFDRNWEGTMSDLEYDPQQCRNISLDIRYALFLIDKYAGATRIIDELNIVE